MMLVPLDGSQLSEAALPYAAAIARALGSAIVLLGVYDVDDAEHQWGRPPNAEPDTERSGISDVACYLESTAEGLRRGGLTVTLRAVQGNAVDAILNSAEAMVAGMIVMATRGRGGLRRWLLGSIADAVMRNSPCPIVLVHPPDQPDRADVHIRRLMVPLDGSPLAEEALGPATALAASTGATIVLVRAVPHTVSLVAGSDPLLLHALAERRRVNEAGEYLQQIESHLAPSVQVESTLLVGMPRVDLVEFATQQNIELVIMSTHGRGGVRRAVLGSTADRIVHCGAPVLLIRPGVRGGQPAVLGSGESGRRATSK